MKTDRALFQGWLNAPGNTPTYFDDQVRNYLDDRFGIESNGRTTNTANLTLAHINLYFARHPGHQSQVGLARNAAP